MGRLVKILLSIIAAIIVLIVAAVVILPLVINPNDFKPEIQAAVKENVGRDLLIEGDLELSVFPWLGISTGKVSLSNAEGFTDKVFAEIKESNVRVKLLPLLSKELEVSRIVLKGLVLNLAKNKQGISNWDDLAKKEGSSVASAPVDEKETKTEEIGNTEQAEESSASPLAALAVGGVSIENAKVTWDDQQQGQYIEINDFNFTTSELVFDEVIHVALSLIINNKEPALTESINFTTDLIVNKNIDIFKLAAVKLESVTKGKDIPGETLTANLIAEIAVDLTQQTLNIAGLKLDAEGLSVSADISGTNIKDNPVFNGPIKIAEFNLAKFMQKMGMPLPEMQDATALSKLSMDLMLKATTDSADIKNLVIRFDDTTINGSSNIKHFAKPAVNFNFDIDAIDADRYLAPKKEGEEVKVIASPASAVAASAGLFPVKTLRDLNVNGLVKIGSLKINQLNLKGLNLKLNAKNGVIQTQQAVKQLYQGAYNGNIVINVKNKTPNISLNEKLISVNIQQLLNDMLGEARITGIVNASAKINGRGDSVDAIKASSNGKIDFNFNEGVIKGFNIQKIIDNSKALLKGTPLPTDNKNDQTVFSIIKGTANITNGLVSNDDLYLEASKLRVNGEGTASLVTDKLDYTVKAKLLKVVLTAEEAEKIKGMPIIVNVGGALSKPLYQLDIAAMLLEKNKGKINKALDENKEKINKEANKILEKLDDKVGPGVGNLIKGFL